MGAGSSKNKKPQTPQSAANPEALHELPVFLKHTLETMRSELANTLAMQETMAKALSGHAMAIAAEASGSASQGAMGILTSLQNEDRIRQRLQGLDTAIATLLEVVSEAEDGVCADRGSFQANESSCRRRWLAALLDAQSLEELEQSFARMFADRDTATGEAKRV